MKTASTTSTKLTRRSTLKIFSLLSSSITKKIEMSKAAIENLSKIESEMPYVRFGMCINGYFSLIRSMIKAFILLSIIAVI